MSRRHSAMPADMWHEARKQERKIRGMLVDYKKRAERRREYYEKIKQDPTQFIQLHGRQVKIHLDPAIAFAAEAPGTTMPWRGDADSIIDRFDVRAHLDSLPPAPDSSPVRTTEEDWEERQANYERYRIIIQNTFMGINEDKFLHQIRLEEQFGPLVNKDIEAEKKALAPKKAAIGFLYEDEPSDGGDSGMQSVVPASTLTEGLEDLKADVSDDDSDSDIDLDLTVDVMSLTNVQQQEMNASGVEYGLNQDDFMALISRDLMEAEELRVAKEHEDEKAMYSGRKSRKERRALKKKHMDRKFSPPSYAARESPTYAPYRRSSSRSKSRSPTPPSTTQIKFITSFGGESDKEVEDEGVTGIIILPKGQKGSGDKHRRKNRWDQKNPPKEEERRRDGGETSYSSSRKRQQRGHYSRSRSRSGSRSRNDLSGRSGRRPSSRSRHRRYSPTEASERYSPTRSLSRSRSRERRSRKSKNSYSHSYSRSRSRSKSNKRSLSPIRESVSDSHAPISGSLVGSHISDGRLGSANSPPPKLPTPPRRQYYGRRAQDSDKSDSESDSEKSNNSHNSNSQSGFKQSTKSNSMASSATVGNGSSGLKMMACPKLTPQERLKKKMQLLLKKQFKADKRVEREKAEKAEQERVDREEELREMAIRLRRREREKRHRLQGDSDSSDDSRSRSRSRSRSGSRSRSRSRSRSKSHSRSKSRQKTRSPSRSPPPKKSPNKWQDLEVRGGPDYSRPPPDWRADRPYPSQGEQRRDLRGSDQHSGYKRRSRDYEGDKEEYRSGRSRSPGRESGGNYGRNYSGGGRRRGGGGGGPDDTGRGDGGSYRDYHGDHQREWSNDNRDQQQREFSSRDYHHQSGNSRGEYAGNQGRNYHNAREQDGGSSGRGHNKSSRGGEQGSSRGEGGLNREQQGNSREFRNQREYGSSSSSNTSGAGATGQSRRNYQSGTTQGNGTQEQRDDGRIGRIRLVDY